MKVSFYWLTLYQAPWDMYSYYHTLQMRTLGHREVVWPAQVHILVSGSWNSISGSSLASNPLPFILSIITLPSLVFTCPPIYILTWACVPSTSNWCLPVMLKRKKGKSKVFPHFPKHWKFQDPGPNCLILPSLILHCLLTQIIFSFSREYQKKLQSRLWNCYPQLSSLPVFSKIDFFFCWLDKYKSEPTTALKSHG